MNKKEIIKGFELENQKNDSDEIRDRVLSIDPKKTSAYQIFSNYIGNMLGNENNDRKLSYEKSKNDSINTDRSQIFTSSISSSSSEYENCNETLNDVNKTKSSELNLKKTSECSNFSQYLTEECTPRTQENKKQNYTKNINNVANNTIKNIMIDFNRFKELLNINQHFDDFNKKKLAKFVNNN